MAAVEIIRNQAFASFVISNLDLITGHVLDVGCGSKPYKKLCPECEWTGLDLRPVGDVEGDMRSLPFEDKSFDTVLCTDALNFTIDPYTALKEMVRVLKDGGHLIVAVQTTAPDDSVFFGIHTSGIVGILRELGMGSISDQETRNVSMSGLFSRAEADNFWTNHTWLEGVANGDIDRFTSYLDQRYRCVSGISAVKTPRSEDSSSDLT